MAAPDPAAGAFAALHTAPLAASMRGWWDAILAVLVMLMASFVEALPHLIQIGGLIVVILTAAEKLIELGWIKNPRRNTKDEPHDPR